MNRVPYGQELPLEAPHLVVASTSSRLAVSTVQADFSVRFYGDYVNDIERGVHYVREKLGTTLDACQAAGISVASLGVVLSVNFTDQDGQTSAVEHLRQVHLKNEIDSETVQDVQVRVAVRLREVYFLNISLSNYEVRMLERPLVPGMATAIRSWEGRVTESGLQMLIDINNVLEARKGQGAAEVSGVALSSVTTTLNAVATNFGPRYAETGVLEVADIADVSRAANS